MSTGTCTVHSWNDNAGEDEAEPKMGVGVNAKLAHDDRLYSAEPPVPQVPATLRSRLRALHRQNE
jgi:WD repeat-containing protein 23